MDKVEVKLIKEKDNFSRALDLCDYETQIRYAHVEELLNQTVEEIAKTATKIEELKLEVDLYNRLDNSNKVRHLQNQLENLEKRLKELNKKYEVIEDLWEEVYFSVLENLD